jgi:hypothetical protein
MKGTLMKTDQGWMVNCNYSINKNDWETLPLHPDFIEMMDTCFTSKFTQEVEFEFVTEWENGEVGVNGLTYAKLIHHPVDTNKMIDHVPDVGKMVEDVEKLAEKYPYGGREGSKRLAFIDGYNTAKETLYTEEQVREVIRNCFKSNSLGFLITEDDMMRTIKQPKQ